LAVEGQLLSSPVDIISAKLLCDLLTSRQQKENKITRRFLPTLYHNHTHNTAVFQFANWLAMEPLQWIPICFFQFTDKVGGLLVTHFWALLVFTKLLQLLHQLLHSLPQPAFAPQCLLQV